MGKLHSLYLDALSLRGKLGSNKFNAEWHLEHVCPRCPEERKKSRYVQSLGDCWWHHNWKNGIYDEIPRNFGFLNYMRYYLGLETRLEDFSEHDLTGRLQNNPSK